MQKITSSSNAAAPLDPSQHGDQQPVSTPADQIIAETVRSEAGAFDILRPTPTVGYRARRGSDR